MANEQFAFIHRARVPSRDQWQQAVDESGFDLVIYEGLQPFSHSGFLPCKLLGADSGVETYHGPASEAVPEADVLKELSGGRDFCITFRWGGSFQEAACAMILSYALARSFGAAVSYAGEPPCASLEAIRADTEAMVEESQKK